MSALKPWKTLVTCTRRISAERGSQGTKDLRRLVRMYSGYFSVWGLQQRDRGGTKPRSEVVFEGRGMVSHSRLAQEEPMLTP